MKKSEIRKIRELMGDVYDAEKIKRKRGHRMTNFEKVAKNESVLALWLSKVVIICGECPVSNECQGAIDKSCFHLLYDWLKRDAEI